MPCPRRASPKRAGPLPPPPRAHWRPTPPAPPLSTLNCCAGAVVPRARAGDWTGTMTKNASDQPLKKQRYLALFFPLLPAERWLRAAPKRPDAPLIFAAKQRGAMRVASVDAAALAVGLRPGMPLADARAQVGNVLVVPHDPVLYQDWLDRLAQGCARYSPLVALDAPDGLILDIAGADHLYGGEAELVRDVERRLARLGVTLRHALGPTADAARALARYQTRPAPDEAQAIRRLPVAALELEAEATTALVRAGLKTIGDLASRPMANIATRFGRCPPTALPPIPRQAP